MKGMYLERFILPIDQEELMIEKRMGGPKVWRNGTRIF
jgi:hypothetical protein